MPTEPDQEAGPRTLRDLFAQAQAEGIPSAVWPGMTLDWDSPFIDIQLHAELPFWLLMPEAELTVAFQDCALKALVTGRAVEIQRGVAFDASRANVIHFEKAMAQPSERAQALIRGAKNRVVLRETRTLLTLQTRALEDCAKALEEGGRRAVDSTAYFQSLAYAHFPYINKIIDAYRKVALDPFAMEVTEWDIPVWFASIGDRLRRISLVPYAEAFPQIMSDDDNAPHPLHLGTAEEVQAALDAGEVPGDVDLLDAWALYYRGRFGDAIRSLVTAIEVVLEAKLSEAFVAKGLSDPEVEKRLEATFNDFERRLADYVQTTRRRIPGPLISIIPYINGIRLGSELRATRQLRHKIVHEGLRLEPSLRGPVFRSMETMSWLFNWFRTDSPIPVTGPEKHYTLKLTMLGYGNLFSHDYTKDGVVIISRWGPNAEDGVVVPEDLRRQLREATDKGTADIEKFAFMCFERLKYQRRQLALPDTRSPFLHERCVLLDADKRVLVFLIDACGLMAPEKLEQVATRVLALERQGNKFSSVFCIVNHQNGLAWPMREVDKAIPEEVSQIASSCGITVMTTVDLLLLVLGAESYDWNLDVIRDSLSKPGRQATCPPNCRRVGTVRHFYERPHVVSVAIDPGATVRVGDTLIVRLQDRYHLQVVDSMQVNRSAVVQAQGGNHAGVKTSLHRADVPLGAVVFLQEMR
jgi:hypothetical protein